MKNPKLTGTGNVGTVARTTNFDASRTTRRHRTNATNQLGFEAIGARHGCDLALLNFLDQGLT